MSNLTPEPDADNVPTLLPPIEESLSAAETFRRFEESFDEFPDATDLVVESAPPHPLGRSWAYDFIRRRFVGSVMQHGPLEIHGLATLQQWIGKCLRTARRAHPIYSDDYGLELPGDFIGGPVSAFPDSVYETAVREALTAHERISNVEDFIAAYDPLEEFVLVNFTVVLDDGTRFPMQNVAVTPA